MSIVVKNSSRGPLFFVQERVGKDGVLFNIIKFRTMFVEQDHNSSISIEGDNRRISRSKPKMQQKARTILQNYIKMVQKTSQNYIKI